MSRKTPPKATFIKEDGQAGHFDVKFNDLNNKWYYIDPKDQLTHEFDEKTKAWFPMWDEVLVESQQSIYDSKDINEEPVEPKIIEDSGNKKRKHKEGAEDKKPKVRINSSVYISGLPYDVTFDELKETFGKCGLFMEDLTTGKPKIKIYQNEKGECKGDALITFFKEESVALAVSLLDESRLRYDSSQLIYVQKAEFSNKESTLADGNNGDNKRPKADPKLAKKRMQNIEKKLDWYEKAGPTTINEKFKKMVLLKHMFTLKELEEDPTLLLDLKEDIRSECEKVGEVTNLVLYDKAPEGVVTVKYKESLSAEACIKMMNGRFFAGRRVVAKFYDGTKYEKSSSKGGDEEEEKTRLENFANWLEKEQ